MVYLMGLMYIAGGIYHFVQPRFYIKMIRNFLPYPAFIVYLSGVIEILLGIGICIPATRSLAAYGVILLLIAIFPANINMAWHADQWKYSPIILWLRLPLQFLLIWWAYQYV